MIKRGFLILACVANVTIAWKIAVMSDLHLNINYNDNITAQTFCEKQGTTQNWHYTDVIAPLGRMGCDPPLVLFERFAKRLNESEPDLSVLFLPGDLVGHSLIINVDQPWNEGNYEKIMGVHGYIADILSRYLPKVEIVPTFGNNDWLYHYQSPYDTKKTSYYQAMYDNWFTKQTTNAKRLDLPSIKTTFL